MAIPSKLLGTGIVLDAVVGGSPAGTAAGSPAPTAARPQNALFVCAPLPPRPLPLAPPRRRQTQPPARQTLARQPAIGALGRGSRLSALSQGAAASATKDGSQTGRHRVSARARQAAAISLPDAVQGVARARQQAANGRLAYAAVPRLKAYLRQRAVIAIWHLKPPARLRPLATASPRLVATPPPPTQATAPFAPSPISTKLLVP